MGIISLISTGHNVWNSIPSNELVINLLGIQPPTQKWYIER